MNRLLVTTKCPNKCPMCCNNSWDFSSLPVVDRLNNMMREVKETKSGLIKGKSLRLDPFAYMKLLLPEHIGLSLWNVKEMKWLENCPVPQGGDFRRIKELW